MYKYKSLKAGHFSTRAFFLQNLVNFIITKYLKKEFSDDLTIGVDERSPLWPLCNWRYKDLSMSHDQKVMALLPPMGKCQINFYHRVAFTVQI